VPALSSTPPCHPLTDCQVSLRSRFDRGSASFDNFCDPTSLVFVCRCFLSPFLTGKCSYYKYLSPFPLFHWVSLYPHTVFSPNENTPSNLNPHTHHPFYPTPLLPHQLPRCKHLQNPTTHTNPQKTARESRIPQNPIFKTHPARTCVRFTQSCFRNAPLPLAPFLLAARIFRLGELTHVLVSQVFPPVLLFFLALFFNTLTKPLFFFFSPPLGQFLVVLLSI